ncbi:hypothetical protein C8Q77DRAFT_1230388 [Trametes polyzona]|nr:hypothetical protein C8Q77DRAFT_1230388 [Trametes polyzona]
MISNDIAALVGFACESALWGVYGVLFVISLGLLFRRGRKGELNPTVFAIHCLLFLASTTHYAIEFNHFYTTLASSPILPHQCVDGYANETQPLVGADILISLCDLLGDAMLIYRCWAMWRGNYWVLVLPVLSAVAGFGCMMQVAHFVVTLSPTAPAPPPAIVPLTVAGYALPLCTNVMASGLLVLKIWWMTRPAPDAHTLRSTARLAHSAMAVVVESGLIYLAVQLVLVVLVSLGHPAEGVVGVIAVQIYGIAPTLMVIRVALGLSTGSTISNSAEVVSQIAWTPRRMPGESTTRVLERSGCDSDGGFYAEAKAGKSSPSIGIADGV